MIVSCGPAPSDRPSSVSPGTLYRYFRDVPETARITYGNQLVRCHLPPKTYRVDAASGEVRWLTGEAGVTGVVFRCRGDLPPDGDHEVEVVGRCHGPLWEQLPDGSRRMVVLVVECGTVSRKVVPSPAASGP